MGEILAPDADGLARAVAVLRGGGVVGMPTETVYGLAADAFSPAAVRRIFAIKRRPADNPLIVHLAATSELERVAASVGPLARRLAERFWPGPLTLVVDAHRDVPRVTTAGLSTVAVRVPDHPVAAALLEAFGGPLAAPSANLSGRPSPTTAAHVLADLGHDLAVVIDGGRCPVGVESTVVDARGHEPVVLREGSITREDLELRGAAEAPSSGIASPGTRYRHYAPRCPLELVPAGEGSARALALVRDGLRVGLVATRPAPEGVVEIATFADAASLARQLYAALRRAETVGLDRLLIESVPELGVGRAVMDRLRRAAD